MSRITQRFLALRSSGERALIPFVTAGDPSLGHTRKLVLSLQAMGADLIELGVPFSDPLADGPTIQRASARSLEAGTTLRAVLEMVEALRGQVKIPLVLMTYFNPIFAFGERKFVEEALGVGVDGVIVPDLPAEEAGELLDLTRDTNLDLVWMLAPTSTDHRRDLICQKAKGFIYYVAHLGVTGARDRVDEDLQAGLAAIRARTSVPVAAGFGIKTPEQARNVSRHADGVIVGSALIDIMDAAKGAEGKLQAAGDFVQSLKQAMKD